MPAGPLPERKLNPVAAVVAEQVQALPPARVSLRVGKPMRTRAHADRATVPVVPLEADDKFAGGKMPRQNARVPDGRDGDALHGSTFHAAER